MLDKAWVHLCRADPGYERGARRFVIDVAAALGDIDKIICPCKDCRNVYRQSSSDVVVHLVTRGMDEAYKLQSDWYHHGDSVADGECEREVNHWNEEILELYRAAEYHDQELASNGELGDNPVADLSEIAEVEDKREDEIKTKNGWSDKSFDELLELVGSDAPTTTTNPEEDHLCQLLGPDNPGRLRAMGRGMSKTKLACFQVKTKVMTGMEEKQVQLLKKVNELEEELSKMKKQRQEPEIGENSAARSVNKRSHPKCVLVDWSGSDENIGEGRILSSDPDDLVNDCRLGPTDLKVLVETATKADAFLWRPATKMFTIQEAVGQIIAWPASKCVLLDKELQIEDIAPLGLRANSMNKCKLLDLSNDDVIVAEGRWQTQEETALVNGLPLGPKAVKVFVDSVLQPETFIWRPTIDMAYLEDCLMAFVSWPVNKVSFETQSPRQHSASTDIPSGSKSAVGTKSAETSDKPASNASKSSGSGSESPIETETRPSSPVRKTIPDSQSPIRKSQRIMQNGSKENKRCKLMDITGKCRVVAEGRWATNDPNQKVHFVPLGSNAVKVWVDIVKVSDAEVWRKSDEIEIMEDALGTVIAWPEDKVIMA
ncbi:unnamed protein product [Arabidopsis arenosa]|uniref:Transposase-associated domain-containing protein n=1 Tax=Arabidopsis arenosa TaxID=38785 RepID=A0A8S1ZRW4_ARAAE|nr:unnamed protein product [Arabidopsis arenosa]